MRFLIILKFAFALQQFTHEYLIHIMNSNLISSFSIDNL